MIWHCVEIFFSVVQCLILLNFLNLFLGQDKTKIMKGKIFFLIAASMFVLMELAKDKVSMINNIDSFIAVSILIIYSLLCLNGSFLKKLFCTILAAVISASVAAILIVMFSKIADNTAIDTILQNPSMERFILLVVSNGLLFYAFKAIVKYNRESYMKSTDFLIFVVYPIISFLFLSSVFYIISKIAIEYPVSVLLTIAVASILIANIFIYGLYSLMGKESEIETKYLMLKNRYELQSQNAENTERIFKNMTYIRHDLKNYLSIVLGYINEKESEKAKCYILELLDEKIEPQLYTYYCMNEYLNYILNIKMNVCKENYIEMTVTMLTDIKCESVDISIIVANILDNAIEAASKTDDKEIRVVISADFGITKIIITNTVKNIDILNSNPNLKTTKADARGHGLGILSVKEMLKNYNGSVDFFVEGNKFTTYLELELPRLP